MEGRKLKNCKLLFKLRPGEGISSHDPITYPLRLSFDAVGNCYVMQVLNVFGSLAYPILSIYNTGEYIIFQCIGFGSIFGSRIKNDSNMIGLITDAREQNETSNNK